MRDLLVAKLILDFKIHFNVAMGTTSSCNARELTHTLLPFALELQGQVKDLLNLALNHLVTKLVGTAGSSSAPQKDSSNSSQKQVTAPMCGFAITHKKPEPVLHYYASMLERLALAHQGFTVKDWTWTTTTGKKRSSG